MSDVEFYMKVMSLIDCYNIRQFESGRVIPFGEFKNKLIKLVIEGLSND